LYLLWTFELIADNRREENHMLTREQRDEKKARLDALNAEIAGVQKDLDEIARESQAYNRRNPGANPWREKEFWEDRARHAAKNWSLAEAVSAASNERPVRQEHRDEIFRR
jgi:chloramphenicol 3-O-phosphotransferase